MSNSLTPNKNLGIKQNVTFRVIDERTGNVVQTYQGHNSATNSLLYGIAHYLKGDGVLNQGTHMLSSFVPRYISLGTMGLSSQEEDENHLPLGIGGIPNPDDPKDEENRFVDYMSHRPGYGADGYDINLNNGRDVFGLGKPFSKTDNVISGTTETLKLGDINNDGVVDVNDLLLLVDYMCDKVTLSEKQLKCADIDKDGHVDCEDVQLLRQAIDNKIDLGTIEYTNTTYQTINCELISSSFPRQLISYREIIPEPKAEQPQTIDIVYSAMISTGALAQFRELGKDYIFITEAGLWSSDEYTDGTDNGLLAGYRLVPTNENYWDMTKPSNRIQLKRSILRVGINQVVQVIWKIQIGSIDDILDYYSINTISDTGSETDV